MKHENDCPCYPCKKYGRTDWDTQFKEKWFPLGDNEFVNALDGRLSPKRRT